MSTVVITGASSGIGRACAQEFLELGCQVHGLDIKPSPVFVHTELCDPSNYHEHICDVRGELPDIENVEILVNCAGAFNSGADIDINLKGLIKCTEKYGVQPHIRSILNLSDVAAHNGASFPEYCASKGGVVAYTVNVAKRVAHYGATCNSLAFGGVVTDLNDVVLNDPDLWKELMDMTPLKKWTTVKECAYWVTFMTITNQSCTGQDIIIDNGEFHNHKFVWKE